MYQYLQAIGLNPASRPGEGRKLYAILNADGSPRWIWNADNPTPDFLRFYAVTSVRAAVFSRVVALLFRLHCQHWFLGRYKLYVAADPSHVLYPYLSGHFALFTGTEGPNRKLVLFAQQQFIKVALGENAAPLLADEQTALTQLAQTPGVEIPRATTLQRGVLLLSDVGKNAVRNPAFSAAHARALHALQSRQAVSEGLFGATDIFRRSLENLAQVEGVSQHKIPVFLQKKLTLLAHILEHELLPTAWAHGDFTPWNCFAAGDSMRLYDFEMARPHLPFGFDVFHFVLQQGILVERLPWKALKPKLLTAFQLWCAETGRTDLAFETCLKAYLLVNTAGYLQLYSRQAQWHTQIPWLLNTWNDALSELLAQHESPRKQLIGDVFDFLHNSPYAALKFPNIDPKSLSEYADIDLLLQKPLANDVLRYLKNHSLVQKISLRRQSNMLALLLVLHDGSVLALDLIWQLRRKALVFMCTADVLDCAVLNQFGVKIPTRAHTQAYLSYFYGLNNSAIPARYLDYVESGADCRPNAAVLKKTVAGLPENTGLAAWFNRLGYGLDTLKSFFRQRGLVITFSGVDGAGKSTVIAHTKRELEKKWRKNVVVIRHRPSLLPILSALTQGREKAEQKAAATLPRQGNNKSLLGSLLRFAYYYTDYFFGQFYVYVRYVMCGNIVLYDRYYFDFINDSLRSNIRLPKWLTKAGYRLLLQPHLNFFLYADAETILQRKKELDARAIAQLTGDYLNLFRALNAKAGGRYLAVENLNLQQTVDFITAQTQSRLF